MTPFKLCSYVIIAHTQYFCKANNLLYLQGNFYDMNGFLVTKSH